jgi:hypothetical protein
MSMAARAGVLYDTDRAPRRAPVAAVQAIITRDRQRALREELSRLRRELEVEHATRLEEARSFGDSSENDDYLQIKEEDRKAETARPSDRANGRIGSVPPPRLRTSLPERSGSIGWSAASSRSIGATSRRTR